MRVVSFDVFDTVLTRVHAASVDLFVELGRSCGRAGQPGWSRWSLRARGWMRNWRRGN